MANHHPIDEIFDDLYGGGVNSINTYNNNIPIATSFLSKNNSSSSNNNTIYGNYPPPSVVTYNNTAVPSQANPSSHTTRNPLDNLQQSSQHSDIFQHSQKIQKRKKATSQAVLNSLLPHERLAITREERTRALWEQRTNEWSKFRTTIAKRLNRNEDELVSTHAEEFRAQREEMDIIDRAKAQLKETDGADGWRSGLRSGGTRYILVGNPFTGLWCPVKETTSDGALMETVRKPRPFIRKENGEFQRYSRTTSPPHTNNNITDGDDAAHEEHASSDDEYAVRKAVPIQFRRHSSAWRKAPELLRKKAFYADYIQNMRPHEIDDNVAAGLMIRGEHLLEWAVRGSNKPQIKNTIITGIIPSTDTVISVADGNISNGPSLQQFSTGSQLLGNRNNTANNNNKNFSSHNIHQAIISSLGGLRTNNNLNKSNILEELHNAEEHNTAILALQLDRARTALIAGNKWKGEKPITLNSNSIGSGMLSMDSFGSTALTPEGSMTSGTALNILRSAMELVPGPHMHVQIISDAATGPEDIGAAIGLTGRLPPIRGGLANRSVAIAAVAVSIGDETGLISALTGTNNQQQHSQYNDILGSTNPTNPPTQPATLVDFHPSWTNSIVLGKTHNDGQIVSMGNTKVGDSAGYANPEFLQTTLHANHISATNNFNTTNILTAIQNITASRSYPQIALECNVGNTSFAKLRISNVGTTVLYYSWTPANEENTNAGGTQLNATAPLNIYNGTV